jgi:hypothetical protein
MTHPRGRRPLSVNQGPTNGTHYPFVCPSDDVSLLLTDAYLSYDDRECGFVRPFRVAWLYGFGADAAATPPFAPTPVNAQEILIFDANDQVVFDSTDAVDFVSVDWPTTDPRAKVLEWKTEEAVARVTWHTEFGINDEVKTYSISFEPEDGQLDARVANRRSPRVNSLRVGLVSFGPDELVEWISGFNIDQEVVPFNTDGGRKGHQITMSAEPGGGKGRFPGCEDPEIFIRRINGQSPLANGNFLMDALGCYAIRQPTVLVANPSPNPNAPELAALAAEATLQAFNDCVACCDCPDYIRTYEGLRRVAKKFTLLGNQAEEIRDQHEANIERWKANASCRAADLCQLTLDNSEPLAVNITSSSCLSAAECIAEEIELRFTIDGPEPWSVRDGSTFRKTSTGIEAYAPTIDTDEGTVSFFFETEEVFEANSARFIVDFPETGTVTVTLEVFIDNGTEVNLFCEKEKATNLIA